MQSHYEYECVALIGEDFDPRFKPDLTPKQVLELGAFGGRYMTDCRNEFPEDWFQNAKLAKVETGLKGERIVHRDPKLNYFGVDASQPLSVWKAKGWINEDHDPRGWFQWYCRYYMGRRLGTEDDRQIKRWVAMRRHVAQIKKNCRAGDFTCHTKQRQVLLHWAYDSREM